jgi:hypothetical protein
VTFIVLATAAATPPPPTAVKDLFLWLESWDRAVDVPLSSGPIRWKSGAAGLEVAPSDLLISATPGVAGASVAGVSMPAREVLLPLTVGGQGWTELQNAVRQLQELTDPEQGMTPDGNFRLVVRSPSGVRQVGLAYRSGLEGMGNPSTVRQNPVLDLLAPQPYAEDREIQSKDWRLAVEPSPFLSTAGTDHPWGTRRLSSSAVAGSGTPVEMFSAVPVYPVIEITGPADSVLITGSNGLLINVPDGVPVGETLRIVTNLRGDGLPPYRKTIRLDGVPAAGMVARGSRFMPFSRGTTSVDVAAPGATSATLLRLSWRGLHRSLF